MCCDGRWWWSFYLMLVRITENTDITFQAKCGVSFRLPVRVTRTSAGPPYKLCVAAAVIFGFIASLNTALSSLDILLLTGWVGDAGLVWANAGPGWLADQVCSYCKTWDWDKDQTARNKYIAVQPSWPCWPSLPACWSQPARTPVLIFHLMPPPLPSHPFSSVLQEAGAVGRARNSSLFIANTRRCRLTFPGPGRWKNVMHISENWRQWLD